MGLPAWVWDPYIIINLLVCLSYLYVRFHFDEDSMLFKNDMMGFTKEMQVGGSCLVALYVKYWKSNSLAEFFPTFFMYSKVAILICTAVQSKTICAWYAVTFLVLFFVLHQGEDKTPNKVVHLNTGNFGSVEDDRESTWLVQFYTTWANAAGFSSTFNALSNKYGSKRLKFGKVDIGRFRTLAKKFNISLSAVMNNELPTLILFEKGNEVKNQRLPVKGKDGKLKENYVILTKENLIKYFKLEERAKQAAAQEAKKNK